MSNNPIAALGARIERQLAAMDAQLKLADSTKARTTATSAVPFQLPDGVSQIVAPTSSDGGNSNTSSTAVAAPIEVGATFRRKGMLSDVPMTVSRTDGGKIFTSFSDGTTASEMVFDPSEIDVVSAAPTAPTVTDRQFFPNLIDLVKKSSPIAMPTSSATDTTSVMEAAAAVNGSAVQAASNATMTATVTNAAASVATTSIASDVSTSSSVSASSNVATPAISSNASAATATVPVAAKVATADASLPAGAIRLPDGTLQFAYVPVGGVVSRAAATQAPVPSEFGVGATFRRKGVADTPMTVEKVGDGVISAMVNLNDGLGVRRMAFVPDQLDLVTSAPG